MIYGQYNSCTQAFDITIKGDPRHTDPPVLLHLPEEDAQRLLQVLWDIGIRPHGREAEMQAVKLHLQDMRRLVFNGTPDNGSQGR